MLNILAELPRPVLRYASGVWRRRWIALIVAWAIALVGWFGVWLLPDQYESRAQVFVQTETILDSVLNGQTARPDYSDRVEVMRLQLLSRPNMEEIIYRAGLDSTINAQSEVERRAKLEGMIGWVAGKIQVVSPRDMYFDISYQNSDPVIARNVVDAVLNLLIEQDLGASLAENEAATRRLDARIVEYGQRLTAKEQEVAQFRAANAEELALAQSAVSRRELKQNELLRVSDELGRTRNRVLELQNLLAATPRNISAGEIDTLRLELAQLRSRYQDSHPDVQDVLARIEQLKAQGGGAFAPNPEYSKVSSQLTSARALVESLSVREVDSAP